MATTNTTQNQLPVPSDVVGGGIIVVLALLQTLVLSGGGLLSFLALLVVWPLLGGAAAAFFSARSRDRSVDGAVAGTFAALTATILVFLSGLSGIWPAFITSNVGVSLWPVTIATLMATTTMWTVFGYLGASAANEAR